MSNPQTELSSSVARVETCLSAIETWQPHVNAMVTLTAGSARAEAAAADRALAEGLRTGPNSWST